jgi:DNA invertase Pin-like site-specific DNA recombinase
MSKTLGYLRVSHLESLNGTSFDTQEKKIRNYCELNELKVSNVFSEVVSGAVEVRKRPALTKIVEQLKRGDSLVVSRIDRLSRSTLHTLQFVQDCKSKGISVHITDLGCVTNGGVGQIVFNVLTCLAETERLNISERIKASKHFAKKERKYLGGALEFGYTKDNSGKLIPNEKEFVILQSMVNLRNQKIGYREIAEQIKRKFGRKISFQQVHKILNRSHNQSLLQVA